MMVANNNPCYILELWDPGVPSFCSSSKMYIGTEDEIHIAADALEKGGSYPDTVKAIREYWNGNRKATHNIAYCEIPILQEATIVDAATIILGYHSWKHLNAWECPYTLQCDSAVVSQIIIRYKNQYYRCLRVWFTNLYYESMVGDLSKLKDCFWGNNGILAVTENSDGSFTISNRLYVVEKEYKTEEEAKADLNRTDAIDFKVFVMRYSEMDKKQYETISLEIESELYEKVTAVLDEIGVTMEQALTMFFRATIACNGFPFPVTAEEIEVAKKDTRVKIL